VSLFLGKIIMLLNLIEKEREREKQAKRRNKGLREIA
jgi:hypothetical protein